MDSQQQDKDKVLFQCLNTMVIYGFACSIVVYFSNNMYFHLYHPIRLLITFVRIIQLINQTMFFIYFKLAL